MERERQNISLKKELPVFIMAGVPFHVDTEHGEFSQVEVPFNCISMREIRESDDRITELAFDCETNNIYEGFLEPGHVPPHVSLVIVPALKDLDPVGLARKNGLPDDTYLKKVPALKRRNRQKRNRI